MIHLKQIKQDIIDKAFCFDNEVIMTCIGNYEPIGQADLARYTGYTRDFVKYKISCLERDGFVITERRGNIRVCSLSSWFDETEKQQFQKSGLLRRIIRRVIKILGIGERQGNADV